MGTTTSSSAVPPRPASSLTSCSRSSASRTGTGTRTALSCRPAEPASRPRPSPRQPLDPPTGGRQSGCSPGTAGPDRRKEERHVMSENTKDVAGLLDDLNALGLTTATAAQVEQ